MSTPPFTAKLPDLPYDYSALEPSIDAEIMRLHHTKHHQAYVTNLNKALQAFAESQSREDISGMLKQLPAIRFNGGGHLNHSIFWTNLAPKDKGGGSPPSGALATRIAEDFGDFGKLRDRMNQLAVGIQGSGWAWLGYCKNAERLIITSCANQDALEAVPLLGIDVWEHAYYLQYKNARAEYLEAIWNVLNWQNVADRFAVATH